MRGAALSMIRTGVLLAVALAAAAAAPAQPTVMIKDKRVVEGSGLNWSTWEIVVTLSAPSSVPVTVDWNTVDGSATSVPGPAQDFAAGSGTLTFSPGSITPQTPLTVAIWGDKNNEWSSTAQIDDVFFIDLKNATNATLAPKSRATVTIIDDDLASTELGLQFVSAVADTPGPVPAGGRVRLQWRVPASSTYGPVTDVVVRWNVDTGSGCSGPANVAGGTGGFSVSVPPGSDGLIQVVDRPELTGLPYRRHCFALFPTYTSLPPTPPRVTVDATPLDPATDPGKAVAWTYSHAGSTPTLAPPTVGVDAVYQIDNDGVVHAMVRGEGGGAWPTEWNPVGLGHAAHNRSPVVPLAYGSRLFVGTESGEVHAVDGVNGSIAWSRSQPFGGTQLGGSGVQATPAGLFKSWGGNNDLILVGTNEGTSGRFFVLDPATGTIFVKPSNPYPAPGAIAAMAAVDYPRSVYFLANGSTTGAQCSLDLGDKDSLVITPSTPVNLPAGWLTIGSPVIRGGKIYFGTTNGVTGNLSVVSGGSLSGGSTGDGNIKGFVFPDRQSNFLYYSTNNKVWITEDTGVLFPKWAVALQTSPDPQTTPSIVLYRPGSNFLYVGGGDGRLYQIGLDPATRQPTLVKSVMLEPGSWIGAPSLDGPNNLVLVGSMTGVVYAVRADFTTGIPIP